MDETVYEAGTAQMRGTRRALCAVQDEEEWNELWPGVLALSEVSCELLFCVACSLEMCIIFEKFQRLFGALNSLLIVASQHDLRSKANVLLAENASYADACILLDRSDPQAAKSEAHSGAAIHSYGLATGTARLECQTCFPYLSEEI